MRILLLMVVMLCSPLLSASTLVVSIEPLAKLMSELYDDSVTVTTLMQPNQSPHHLSLSPRQALLLRQADRVVWLGEDAEPPLAPLMARTRGETLALLSLSGLHRRYGEHHHHDDDHTDDHDHDHDHDVHTLDPHLWLSVDNMARLAEAVAARWPEGLRDGEPQRTVQALQGRQQQWQAQLAPLSEVPWLSYHHPWGYFSDGLGLREPVVMTGQLDGGPGGRHFVALHRQLAEQQVQCAIREPEARQALMARVCPQCQQVALDPLGRDQPGLGYLVWLDGLVEGFADCLAVTGRE